MKIKPVRLNLPRTNIHDVTFHEYVPCLVQSRICRGYFFVYLIVHYFVLCDDTIFNEIKMMGLLLL